MQRLWSDELGERWAQSAKDLALLTDLPALADKGHDLRLIQDYLGHRDPRHNVHYTRTAGRRFEGLWSR